MGKKKSDVKNKTRQSHVMNMLKAAGDDGLSARDLTQKLIDRNIDVSEKTVRRDITDLSLDYEIGEIPARPTRFLLKGDRIQAKIELTYSEIQTLAIAIGALRASSHDIFSDYLAKLEVNILDAIAPAMAKLYEKTQKEYLFVSSSGKAIGGLTEDLQTILLALRRRRPIKVKYASPYEDGKSKKPSFRKFEPLRLVVNNGIPYLDAWDLDKKAIRRLRLTRLSDVSVLDQTIDEAHMKKLQTKEELFGAYSSSDVKPIAVKITGSEVLASYFGEQIIHPSQHVSTEGVHTCVSWKIPASHEFTRLLASLSPHINKISPKSLKDLVVATLEQGLKSIK